MPWSRRSGHPELTTHPGPSHPPRAVVWATASSLRDRALRGELSGPLTSSCGDPVTDRQMLLQEHPPPPVRAETAWWLSFKQEGDLQEPVFKNATLLPFSGGSLYRSATRCSLLTVSPPVQPNLAPGPRTELGPAQLAPKDQGQGPAVSLAAAGGMMEAEGPRQRVSKVTECGSKMPFHVKALLPCL